MKRIFWILILSAGLYALILLKYMEMPMKISPSNMTDASEFKTVVFVENWFGRSWNNRFGPTSSEELRDAGCPTWKCIFTYNQSLLATANAVLVTLKHFKSLAKHKYHRPPEQRWIFVDVEPPYGANGKRKVDIESSLVNWTMSYHSKSDVLGGYYGYFKSLGEETLPYQANLMSEHKETLKRYTLEIDKNTTLGDILGPSWTTYVNKSKPLAWMVSNCKGLSGRKDYVDELAKFIPIDIYGACSGEWCLHKKSSRTLCWEKVLSWQYSFYLSFENNLCEEYITEKAYFPLVYGVIPVVYGGVDYDRYLPPNSYINARDFHPQELAQLLLKLHEDPVALGRYHLWRGFWKVENLGSFCHLCHRLHTEPSHQQHTNINMWKVADGHCNNPKFPLFNNLAYPDACKEFIATNMSCISQRK